MTDPYTIKGALKIHGLYWLGVAFMGLAYWRAPDFATELLLIFAGVAMNYDLEPLFDAYSEEIKRRDP